MQQSQLSQKLLTMALDYGAGEKKFKLEELKLKLAACELCADKTTAAAFGYLLAQEECPPVETNIYDEICSTIDEACNCDLSSEEACEVIMGLVYAWLIKGCKKYKLTNGTEAMLKEMFDIYVKPGVIS